MVFFFQAEDGIRDRTVTGVQTCALPISAFWRRGSSHLEDDDGAVITGRPAAGEAREIGVDGLDDVAGGAILEPGHVAEHALLAEPHGPPPPPPPPPSPLPPPVSTASVTPSVKRHSNVSRRAHGSTASSPAVGASPRGGRVASSRRAAPVWADTTKACGCPALAKVSRC